MLWCAGTQKQWNAPIDLRPFCCPTDVIIPEAVKKGQNKGRGTIRSTHYSIFVPFRHRTTPHDTQKKPAWTDLGPRMEPVLPSDSQLAQSMQGVKINPSSSPAEHLDDAGQLPSQGAADAAPAAPAAPDHPAQLAPASSYKSPAELLSAPSSGKVCRLDRWLRAHPLRPLRPLACVRTTPPNQHPACRRMPLPSNHPSPHCCCCRCRACAHRSASPAGAWTRAKSSNQTSSTCMTSLVAQVRGKAPILLPCVWLLVMYAAYTCAAAPTRRNNAQAALSQQLPDTCCLLLASLLLQAPVTHCLPSLQAPQHPTPQPLPPAAVPPPPTPSRRRPGRQSRCT